MSVHKRFFVPVVFSALTLFSLAWLIACGGNGKGPNPIPPPTGGFTNADLNGTYVFTTSGTDYNGAPYAIVGTFAANGNGGITGGTFDIVDESFTTPAVPNQSISGSSSYKVTSDGRGQATLANSTPFNKIVLDFVLADKSHGMVTEFDTFASGSGTLDLQTSGAALSGTYAFEFAGATSSSSAATVGNFTVPSGGGAITAGLEDLNTAGASSADQAITGTVVLGPASTPGTSLTITSISHTVTYDVYAIDSTHLKFIEMDGVGTLNGDAFSQTSASMPVSSTLAFTMMGGTTTPVVAGGYMVTDSSGNLTSSSSEDVNPGGNPSTVPFSAMTTAQGAGRFTLATSGFSNGSASATAFAAYPSTGGLLLLEVDDLGIMVGTALVQTSGATFTQSQGYGMNLSGVFPSSSGSVEVDDIAEFTATSGNVTGIIDENAPGVSPNFDLALSGSYTTPDSSGRGSVSANAGNNSNSTLNGGFGITFYLVDGTTFPFIETDNGQVASGVLVLQSSSGATPAIKRSNMMVVPPLAHPNMARRRTAE